MNRQSTWKRSILILVILGLLALVFAFCVNQFPMSRGYYVIFECDKKPDDHKQLQEWLDNNKKLIHPLVQDQHDGTYSISFITSEGVFSIGPPLSMKEIAQKCEVMGYKNARFIRDGLAR